MRTFLVRNKKPICKWGQLQQGTMFQGTVPEGYDLGISPTPGIVIIDVDRHGDKDGFTAIPVELLGELENTLNYPTKNNGRHYWFYYTGKECLGNKTSGQGIDLRNEKGYVVWYPKEDIHECIKIVKESSEEMNQWLEKLFCFKHNQK
jgi:hypothetical protein